MRDATDREILAAISRGGVEHGSGPDSRLPYDGRLRVAILMRWSLIESAYVGDILRLTPEGQWLVDTDEASARGEQPIPRVGSWPPGLRMPPKKRRPAMI